MLGIGKENVEKDAVGILVTWPIGYTKNNNRCFSSQWSIALKLLIISTRKSLLTPAI